MSLFPLRSCSFLLIAVTQLLSAELQQPAAKRCPSTSPCQQCCLASPSFVLNLHAELFLLILLSRHLFSINLLMISCHPLLFHLCPPFRARVCIHTLIFLSWQCLAPTSFTKVLIQSQCHFYCFLFITIKRRLLFFAKNEKKNIKDNQKSGRI